MSGYFASNFYVLIVRSSNSRSGQTSYSVIQGHRNGLHVVLCFPDSSSRLCKEYLVFSHVILRKSYSPFLLTK